MAASPHLRPEPGTTSSSSLAPVAYNSAGKAGRTQGEGVKENWKPQEGQVVEGKFRLLQPLGGTDHSVVFLTEHAEEPKKAVIKLVPAVNSENQILHWKLDTKLPHAHLLQIFESGKCELNGQQLLYVVMEYAEEDLSQILPHRPLTPIEAREMLLPVLDALSYLHAKGFVHGSIKPANILAVADHVKLSSDSISAISEGVVTNGSKATTAYDPPEAKEGKISPVSDIWSLGITLSEVLTLQKPVWDATKKQEPALPKGLDESFRILIRNCLRPDPASRWKIAEIKSLLQPEKIPAGKVTHPSRPSAWLYAIPIVILLVLGFLFNRIKHSTASPSATPEISVVPEKPAQQAPTKSTTPESLNTKSVASAAPKAKPGNQQTAASVIQQVLPEVPASARRTITGKIRVRVKVLVDEKGNVTEVNLDDPGPSKYFARLSQQAAEKWKFTPAQLNGQPVASQWQLRFVFTSSNTDASSQEVRR